MPHDGPRTGPTVGRDASTKPKEGNAMRSIPSGCSRRHSRSWPTWRCSPRSAVAPRGGRGQGRHRATGRSPAATSRTARSTRGADLERRQPLTGQRGPAGPAGSRANVAPSIARALSASRPGRPEGRDRLRRARRSGRDPGPERDQRLGVAVFARESIPGDRRHAWSTAPPANRRSAGAGAPRRIACTLVSSAPTDTGNGWVVRYQNGYSSARTVYAWVICAQVG